MYRKVASIPVRRCICPESSQPDLATQPPGVPDSVAESLDLAGDQPASGVYQRARVEDVVPGRPPRRTVDGQCGDEGAPFGPPLRGALRPPARTAEQASEA